MCKKPGSVKGRIMNLVKFLVFSALGVVLYMTAERIFLPKWNYPVDVENISYNLESFYGQDHDTNDALFLGTSHMVYGISPMEIYRKYGLVTYNLATSAQRTSGSYYQLKEALKTQHPKVAVLDVSNLFLEETNDAAWRYILDSMPSLVSKIPMALAYAGFDEIRNGGTFQHKVEAFTGACFPLYSYHNKWESMTNTDFRDFMPTTDYYAAGYQLSTACITTGQSKDAMNDVAGSLAADTVKKTVTYADGQSFVDTEEDPLYDPKATEENLKWLDRIQKLCEDTGTQLLLAKIPSYRYPNYYDSAWTMIRSEYMKTLAKSRNLPFFDLVYDVELDIDIDQDFMDGGGHLNYAGAKKASDAMGQYLMDHYSLLPKKDDAYEKRLEVYLQLTELATLQLEQDLPEYINALYENRDHLTVILSARDEMTAGLDETDMAALKKLGLEAAFGEDPGFRDAYIAVIDSGDVMYEASSNRAMKYEGELSGGRTLSVDSQGWNTGSVNTIVIDGIDYSANGNGINIVVYDKKTGLVVDSVSFNTYNKAPHDCAHNKPQTRLEEYWMKIQQAG